MTIRTTLSDAALNALTKPQLHALCERYDLKTSGKVSGVIILQICDMRVLTQLGTVEQSAEMARRLGDCKSSVQRHAKG
jgi:hypothetical protein